MINSTIGKLCFVVVALAGLSCASNKSSTIGQLRYDKSKEKEIKFEKLSHEQVRQEYKELIDLFEDKKLKERIERRIADVYMLEANDDPKPKEDESSVYIDAIKSYRNILERYPDSPENAEVFYQLAKAYDLEGNQKEAMKMLSELVARHPGYKNIAEAHFRKADIHFNWEEYDQAKLSYEAVTKLTEGRLHLNARYMLGWVYYKKMDFESSINSFAYVLNNILINNRDISTLDKAEKPLVDDSIHSMSLALDKLGGAEAIGEIAAINDRYYLWMIYDYLGGYYLEKELFEQSASTFRHFVTRFPQSEHAPGLHNKLINAYTSGKFPRLALQEKESYVAAYGIYSNFPGNKAGISELIKSSLKVYIEELAGFNYSEGQVYQESINEEREKNKDKADLEKIKQAEFDSIASYKKAARFYGEFLATFPNDPRVDEIRFLRAESNFLAKEYLLAAGDYDLVAYSPAGTSAKTKAPDSGYATIISYQKHIENLEKQKDKKIQKQVDQYRATAVESMLKFSKKFDADTRAPTVLTNAAEYLFGLDQYERAIAIAQDLVAKQNLDKTLMKTAFGIMAHSQFKLEQFAAAEQSYLNQRALVASGGEEYKKITERVAASIFKNSEVIEKEKSKLEAANELLKIKRLAPESPIRITAQHDAATLLMAVEEWAKAIVELKQLIALFPDHELSQQFPRKLALAYEKNGEWLNAAQAYLDLYKNDKDSEIKREALFKAGQMFENTKDYESAITWFRRYAYDYEEPFDMRMEARYRLAINYEAVGDVGKQLYWLRRIIDGDTKSGKQRTERSKWLAAWSNAKYADHFTEEFNRTRLWQPLQKSLPPKQQLFADATSYYQKSADYGILEFITMSSFKIGVLYEAFARDLRRAPTPVGLSAADLQMYNEIINEQASPFDQLAIDVYQANIDRAWEGAYDEWIEKSFVAIKRLNPARYNKEEVSVDYGEGIR